MMASAATRGGTCPFEHPLIVVRLARTCRPLVRLQEATALNQPVVDDVGRFAQRAVDTVREHEDVALMNLQR